MSEIRILSADDFDALADIFINAYPGWMSASAEEKERIKQHLIKSHQEEPTVTYYGLWRDGQLLGGMRFHDFTMNFLQTQIPAAGVGQVAVDLVHKKEHVAKEMIAYFLQHYREQGVSIALLYPFRPDFYKKMGFGYGTKMSQYRVKPAALPRGPSKAHVRYLGEDDEQALWDCYTRLVSRTHGMIEKSQGEIAKLIKNPQLRIVGYEQDGQVVGYLAFIFDRGENAILNDIHVREFVYESREALSELCSFLHTQADQIRYVIFETQDESFHHLLLDPRNDSVALIPSVYHGSNTQGVGIMYRVLDTPGIFNLLQARDFGGQSCRLKLTLEDSFLPENAGSTLLCLEGGRLMVVDDDAEGRDYDVQLRMDVAEFSSLLVGAVNLRSLDRYGLTDLSDRGYLGVLDEIFAVQDKPICMTHF